MTYMQKIDTSAMMRELTEHETEIVSGGFGAPDFSVNLPNSAVPAGYGLDQVSNVEFIYDSVTSELTTILTFDDFDYDDTRSVDFGGIEENGRSGSRTTTTTRTSASGELNGNFNFDITIPFIGRISGSIGGVIRSGTVTRTESVTLPNSSPPQIGGGNRNGPPAPIRRK